MNDTTTERAFTQLPNGDLWRGRVDTVRPDNVDATAPATPEDAVMEMIANQNGETVHCQWCGEAFTRKQLNEIRDHVETRHASALKPVNDLAALAEIAADKIDVAKLTPSAAKATA